MEVIPPGGAGMVPSLGKEEALSSRIPTLLEEEVGLICKPSGTGTGMVPSRVEGGSSLKPNPHVT